MRYAYKHALNFSHFFLIAFVLLGFWLLPQICQAHSLFIQASRYTLNKGKSSPIFFCYGHHVPADDGVRANKLKQIIITNPEGVTTPVAIRQETCLHSYMISYDSPGTWMLTAETNPGFYTVYIDKKGRERHTIKPMSKIRDKADKILKSLYSKQYTKTYVACDKPEKGDFKTAGLDLELLPINDIFSLKPGQNLELEVLHNGKPFTGKGIWDATYNGFSTLAEDMFYSKTTVTGSRISIPVLHSGRWFVRYFIKVDAPDSEKDNYLQLKQTATLTFQVDNQRKRLKADH